MLESATVGSHIGVCESVTNATGTLPVGGQYSLGGSRQITSALYPVKNNSPCTWW